MVDSLLAGKDVEELVVVPPANEIETVADQLCLRDQVEESVDSFLHVLAIRHVIADKTQLANGSEPVSRSGKMVESLRDLMDNLLKNDKLLSAGVLEAFGKEVEAIYFNRGNKVASIPTTLYGVLVLLTLIVLSEELALNSNRYVPSGEIHLPDSQELIAIATYLLSVVGLLVVGGVNHYCISSVVSNLSSRMGEFDGNISRKDLMDRDKMRNYALEKGLDNPENLELFLATEFESLKSTVIEQAVTVPLAKIEDKRAKIKATMTEAEALPSEDTIVVKANLSKLSEDLDTEEQGLRQLEAKLLAFFDRELTVELSKQSANQANERNARIDMTQKRTAVNETLSALGSTISLPAVEDVMPASPVRLTNLYNNIIAELSKATRKA